jgi:hypothetical protein
MINLCEHTINHINIHHDPESATLTLTASTDEGVTETYYFTEDAFTTYVTNIHFTFNAIYQKLLTHSGDNPVETPP